MIDRRSLLNLIPCPNAVPEDPFELLAPGLQDIESHVLSFGVLPGSGTLVPHSKARAITCGRFGIHAPSRGGRSPKRGDAALVTLNKTA